MGRYSVQGEITFIPGLTWAEIQASNLTPRAGGWTLGVPGQEAPDVKLRVDTDTVETDDGTLYRKTAGTLLPATEDPYRCRTFQKDVQAFLDQYGAGRTFRGRFVAEGEDQGDMWRLEVVDGRAVKVDAVMCWADEMDALHAALCGYESLPVDGDNTLAWDRLRMAVRTVLAHATDDR